MSKECTDCGNERVMTCPNCDNRTAIEMDASSVEQTAASGGEKPPTQVIDELRARIAELEAEHKRLAEEVHYSRELLTAQGTLIQPIAIKDRKIKQSRYRAARAANDARAGKEADK